MIDRRTNPACLLPGIVGAAVFALYPLWIEPAALTAAIEPLVGASPAAAGLARNADALLLIGGIVLSAACWFYAELRQRHDRARGRATAQPGVTRNLL